MEELCPEEMLYLVGDSVHGVISEIRTGLIAAEITI